VSQQRHVLQRIISNHCRFVWRSQVMHVRAVCVCACVCVCVCVCVVCVYVFVYD
jgi:hypothetical protein